MKFKGKIDLWFWLIMLFGDALILLALLDSTGFIVGIVTAVIYNIIFIPLVVRNYVEVTDEELRIVMGFSKVKIPLSEIVEVYRTHNPISSMAASVDRIMIQAKNTQVMCAVQDKKAFFACLKEKNPSIQIPDKGAKGKTSKMGKFGIGFSVVIIAVCAILLFTGNVNVEFDEETFVIKATYWYDKEIAYEEVESIEFRNEKISGARTGGWGSMRLLLGDFNNKEFGNYLRYTYNHCDAGIVLVVKDKEIVVSGKDAESTYEIYEELMERCGYEN